MKQVLIKQGQAVVEEIPAPTVAANTVLVQVEYSCISVGTEMSAVQSSGESIITKALKQPEKVSKAFAKFKNEGLSSTIQAIQKVHNKTKEDSLAGYSASGIVLAVGAEITDIAVGDRVACAGAGIANHAEYIEVPHNLLVKVPDGVASDAASTVTLGAIALQGVRRTNPTLGEYVAVVGLGILGQLTVQLLKADGCRVIGIDLDDRRLQIATELGMDRACNAANEDVVQAATAFSDGYGVDAVIITAATSAKEPLSQAFRMCRRKGRVVLVGVVGMEIDREDMYKKELDFLISTSYGPGRYDDAYEQKGVSYPYAYVRWTETRNMMEYLKLIAGGRLNLQPLIEKVFPITEAAKAYDEFKTAEVKPLIVLLQYDQRATAPVRRVDIAPISSQKRTGAINIALVGAGAFAKLVHLPNIAKLKEHYSLHAVMSKTGSNAKSTAQTFGAKYATTDYDEILRDKNVDAVLIATRHNLHAEMSIAALRVGKAVFVEKPMATCEEDLDKLVAAIQETGKPFMVGFNRRFSRYATEIKKHVTQRINPMIISYTMNAGYIPLDHWVHTEEGGGRIIGEACHIFDLFNYFIDEEIESVSVEKISPKTDHYSSTDNIVTMIKYADGSVCNLIYTSLGSSRFPKETCQIFFDGKVITLHDYKKLEGHGVNLKKVVSQEADKGQAEELLAFAQYVKGQSDNPIPLWQQIQATTISLCVGNSK